MAYKHRIIETYRLHLSAIVDTLVFKFTQLLITPGKYRYKVHLLMYYLHNVLFTVVFIFKLSVLYFILF